MSPSPPYLHQTGANASANAGDSGSGVASQSCGPVDTSSAGDHTVTCTATDNAGNTSSETIHYTVKYKLLGFFPPASHSNWRLWRTVPVKVALADVNEVRITDAEAAALATAGRVTFSARGAQAPAPQAMKYDAAEDQLLMTWKLADQGTGPVTITVTVTYSGTTTTTTISESITITA